MFRIRRDPGSNCKMLDYVPRDAANSVALRAFRENWCLVGKHQGNPQYVAICCSCKALKVHGKLGLVSKETRGYNEFINGNYTIRHKQGEASGVWSDLASEQTYTVKWGILKFV